MFICKPLWVNVRNYDTVSESAEFHIKICEILHKAFADCVLFADSAWILCAVFDVELRLRMCTCVWCTQLADGESERPHFCRLASQSSISSHLSASLEHVMSVMSFHPKYLHCFQQTHYYLMHEDGSLPFQYRHYIAVMVSSVDSLYHWYTWLLIHKWQFSLLSVAVSSKRPVYVFQLQLLEIKQRMTWNISSRNVAQGYWFLTK